MGGWGDGETSQPTYTVLPPPLSYSLTPPHPPCPLAPLPPSPLAPCPLPMHLKVQQIDRVCRFDLSWGQGQQLSATLDYPVELMQCYYAWQQAYLSFYKSVKLSIAQPSTQLEPDELRGRTIASGSFAPAVDWQARLVEAETHLLQGLHCWLRQGELFEIRAAIAQSQCSQVFLTCTPIELARFPWEAWEIGSDFAAVGAVRLVRIPATIRAAAVPLRRRGRARILAILGDDTGLNFQADRAAVADLTRIAEVQFVGWQPGQSATEVKEAIRQAIADDRGWDVLFFAGHSNETLVTGGELAIAPGVSLQICEIAAPLTLAQSRGLQFALFNSCSGLAIAESLIDLGLSQVAVMREPIHNRVAQEFLRLFLHHLAAHRDVQESLQLACQFLRLEKNLTYPSAYLLPSLFCRPGAAWFQLPRIDWRLRLRQALPTRWQTIAFTACAALSLVPPAQTALLHQRLWTQALYRQTTAQVPPPATPPVLLVQIDDASLRRDPRIANPNPINRRYLAAVVDRLAQQKARVVGVDYLLDRPVGDEPVLAQAIRKAVSQHQTWFVFGAPFSSFEQENLFAARPVADPAWSLQGYVSILPEQVTLPYPDEDCRAACPFGYWLALLHTSSPPPPQLSSSTDSRSLLAAAVAQAAPKNPQLQSLQRSRLSPVSASLYDTLGLPWFDPIVDYSIPPDRIYRRLAAWRLLEHPESLPDLSHQIVIIAAGGYTEAGGVKPQQVDYYSVPPAVEFWRDRLPRDNGAATFRQGRSQNTPDYLPVLTGGEIHAYSLHHLLHQRLVVPVPDLLLLGLAGLLGRGLADRVGKRKRPWAIGLALATGLYGFASLQLFVSASVLLPWLLPSSLVWLLLLPRLKKEVRFVTHSTESDLI